MVQGSLNPNITFVVEKTVTVEKMPIKSVKMKNLKKEKNAFLSHIPRIIQPKN